MMSSQRVSRVGAHLVKLLHPLERTPPQPQLRQRDATVKDIGQHVRAEHSTVLVEGEPIHVIDEKILLFRSNMQQQMHDSYQTATSDWDAIGKWYVDVSKQSSKEGSKAKQSTESMMPECVTALLFRISR
jgi:hypothetical protein